MLQPNNSFCKGFEKVATTVGRSFAGRVMGMKPTTAKKVYYGLEQGGLGALTGIDLHEARKAQKEGDKAARNKALLGAGALTGLMGATHLAHKMGH